MQFSDTSGKTGLYQDAQFLVGLDSNAFAIADFTRSANRWYYKGVIEAWKASDDWQFDDSNQSNFSIATTTLVASQHDYSLPSNALKMDRVEVKDAAGNWSVVRPFDESELPNTALTEFNETDGLPKYYRMVKNSVWLYPAPAAASVTLSAGLQIYYLREVDEFTTADTTQEPGLAEPFHRILSLGSAYDFAIAKNMSNASALRNEVEILLRDLRDFYSGRHENFKLKLRPRRERYS